MKEGRKGYKCFSPKREIVKMRSRVEAKLFPEHVQGVGLDMTQNLGQIQAGAAVKVEGPGATLALVVMQGPLRQLPMIAELGHGAHRSPAARAGKLLFDQGGAAAAESVDQPGVPMEIGGQARRAIGSEELVYGFSEEFRQFHRRDQGGQQAQTERKSEVLR